MMNITKIGAGLFGGFLLSIFAYGNYVEYQDNQKKLQQQEEIRIKIEQIKAEREKKLAAMSPEERTKFIHDVEVKKKEAERVRLEEQKKKDEKEKFEKTRYTYELLLKSSIRTSAYDPDSLIFGNTDYYSNGVCIHVNGKNRFGGYVGFKEYCAMMDKNGKWKIRQ